MKKLILFVFVPVLAVIFCSLALTLLSKSVSPYTYSGVSSTGRTFIVDISSSEYLIQEKVLGAKLPVDYGLTISEGENFDFKSRVTGVTPDIEIIDVFSIKYNGITLHSTASTTLISIYGIMIVACYCVTGIALVKIPKDSSAKQ